MDTEDQYKEINRDMVRWRRHLPHFHAGGNTLFVTWRCLKPFVLEKSDRADVMDCVRHFHLERNIVFAAVVMPDHVHILIEPLERT
ncbi:MAG: hypothetical protein H6839_04405 [Planctomycetes bacterium]|nr:hypothetical protein [Planctomycetota bacterium]